MASTLAPKKFPSAKASLPLIAANLILIGILFYPALKNIAEICWVDEDYSHGLLLPFVSLYFIWERLKKPDKLSTPNSVTRLLPCLLLAMGGLCYLASLITQSLFVAWVAFFPTTIAVVYLSFGRRLGTAFAFPFLLLFMAKPLPDSLVPKLFSPFQTLAARASAMTLELVDVPVFLMGNIIEIPGMRLQVEEACSGMRSLISLLTVAFIIMGLVRLPAWGKVTTVVIAILTAIVLNIVRVAATGLLAHFVSENAADGFFHTFSGMIVFFVGLIIVYSLVFFLTRFQQGPST